MKRKLIGLIVACSIVFSLTPTYTFATETPASVNGLVPEEYELVYPEPRATLADLPASYDSRSNQTAVRNQGSNGLCWAFGAYAAFEANIQKNGLGSQDFSEAHMGYSTSQNSDNSVQGWDRTPSAGGNRYYASSYLMRGTNLSGAVDEDQDPYNTTELPSRDLSITQSKPKSYVAENIIFLSGNTAKADAATIKQAVQTYGAVTASMYSEMGTTSSDSTQTSYYNNTTAAYYYDGNKTSGSGDSLYYSTNHAVTIVGWDDNYAISNFSSTTQPANPGAWLVKNSWGNNWGDDGYFWISYEDTNFPFSAYAFDGAETYDTSKTVYEYDYKCLGAGYGTSSASDRYFAKVYQTNTAAETLTQVRFFALAPMTGGISVIPEYTDSTSLVYSVNTSIDVDYPGWYTVDLSTPVSLGETGSSFAVIIKVDGSSNGTYMAYDSANTVDTGISFRSQTGNSSWTDDSAYNYCIKAITTTEAAGTSGLPDTSAEDMRNVYMLVFLVSAVVLGTALIHRRKEIFA